MTWNWNRDHIFALSLQVVLGAMMLELAATTSFGILEVALIALLGSFGAVAWRRWGPHPLRAAKSLCHACGKLGLPVLIFFFLYLAADLLGVFRSPVPGRLLEKYKVVLLMLFVSACLLFYCNTHARVRSVLAVMAGTSAGIVMLALLNGVWLKIIPVYYTLRLTLRRDYNVFATTILLGYLCAVYWFLDQPRSSKRNAWLLAADTALTLPVLYLSSSRRVFVLLPFVLVLWLGILLARSKSVQQCIRTLSVIMVIGLAAWAVTGAMQMYLHGQYEIYGSHGPTGTGNAGEGSAQERYETVTEGSGSMLTKRKLIWGIAWKDYQSFHGLDQWIGRGFGYNIQLYDDTDHAALREEYQHLEGQSGLLSAHNFILADLLDGGIVKAALGIGLVIVLILIGVPLVRRKFLAAAFYGCTFGIVLIGSLISNRYGLLYDKFFYVLTVLLLIERRLEEDTACSES